MTEDYELPDTDDISILLSAMAFQIAMNASLSRDEQGNLHKGEGSWSENYVAWKLERFDQALEGLVASYQKHIKKKQ